MQESAPQTRFEQDFDIYRVPPVTQQIALFDGVADVAKTIAEQEGLDVLDYRKMDSTEALRAVARNKVYALLGRGDFDKALAAMITQEGHGLFDEGVRVLARLGSGVDHDTQRAFERGVVVERTPGNTEVVRLWDDLMLHAIFEGEQDYHPVVEDDRKTKNGGAEKFKWDRRRVSQAVNPDSKPLDALPREAQQMAEHLQGKKVAIIGAGAIGQEVIDKSPFLRLAQIVVYDPFLEGTIERTSKAEALEDALQDAEVVILHVSGEKEVLGANELRFLKDGAIVINNARGGVVNPQALLEAIESGKVGSAGLDTHVVEGKKLDQYTELPDDRQEWAKGHYAVALRRHEKVLATNHSAASEVAAQDRNAEAGMRQVLANLRYGRIQNGVNAPDIDFPFGGWVRERYGRLGSTFPNDRVRIAMQILHDGSKAGFMSDIRGRVGQALGGPLDVRQGALAELERNGGTRNSVDFFAYDLPPNVIPGSDNQLARTLKRVRSVAGKVKGVYGVEIFHPRPKNE